MPNINIYQTTTMLHAVEQMEPIHSFLRDRYFPTGAGDVFPTNEVLVEYKSRNRHKMAPIVVNGKSGIYVNREGYETFRMAPPVIAPKRALTEDDLNKKDFGENLFSQQTPAQRQSALLGRDLVELDETITNREEFIAAKCMFENGYTLKQYADEYGSEHYKPYEMKFYEEDANPAIYAPSHMWNDAASSKLDDLYLMVRKLVDAGNAGTDVLLGADAADELMNDTEIQRLLDLNRYDIGSIAPQLMADGATLLGVINAKGRRVNLITYDGVYEDEETGEIKPYVPAKQICVTTPGAGRTLYGCVTQVEQNDGLYHSYMGRRVPRYWSDKDGRELMVSAKPLLVPKTRNPFISATVLE